MNQSTQERLFTVISQQLGVPIDAVTADSKFAEDLNADSLDNVEMVMAIEDEFGLEIPDEHWENWTTPADALAYVEKHLQPA